MTRDYIKALPDIIRIGPYDIKVEKVEKIDDRDDDYAQFLSVEEKLIIIYEFGSKFAAADTVIHELLHGIWKFQHLPKKSEEERTVSVIATGLITIFRDNPKLLKWISQAYD